mgnify:CR=1 FL=1
MRNPWAVATALNQGKHTGNSGTSKGAYVAGINRNEWNSPEGMEAASERSAEYHGMRKDKVYVKGPGNGRESAIRSIHNAGVEVTEIFDVTPVPHNGCRPPKRRRV